MRDTITYRHNRRGAWWAIRQNRGAISWPQFNANLAHMGYGIGTQPKGAIAGFVARSKYMPHIGAKQSSKASAAA